MLRLSGRARRRRVCRQAKLGGEQEREAVCDGVLWARRMGVSHRGSAWFGRNVLWGEMPRGRWVSQSG